MHYEYLSEYFVLLYKIRTFAPIYKPVQACVLIGVPEIYAG
ncbi:MAG: hypothetical protein R2792_04090 [Saprospiraceae bacterium]